MRLLPAFLIVTGIAGARLLQPIPKEVPGQRSYDTAGIFGQDQHKQIEQRIRECEQATNAQLAILIVTSTAPETIEEFSARVFDFWKPGDSLRNDGILIVIALADRRMRIQVGRGIAGQFSDSMRAGVTDGMAEAFRHNEYLQGILLAIKAIEINISVSDLPVSEPESRNKDAHAPRLAEPAITPARRATLETAEAIRRVDDEISQPPSNDVTGAALLTLVLCIFTTMTLIRRLAGKNWNWYLIVIAGCMTLLIVFNGAGALISAGITLLVSLLAFLFVNGRSGNSDDSDSPSSSGSSGSSSSGSSGGFGGGSSDGDGTSGGW